MNPDRKKRVDFHVESHDYFATLATIISFLHESLESQTEEMGRSLREVSHSASALQRIQKDLLYLQQQFRIERKAEKGV